MSGARRRHGHTVTTGGLLLTSLVLALVMSQGTPQVTLAIPRASLTMQPSRPAFPGPI